MALLWIDGFDHYANSPVTFSSYGAGAYDVFGNCGLASFPVIGGYGISSADAATLSRAISSHSAPAVLGAGAHVHFTAGFWNGRKCIFDFASSSGNLGPGMVSRRDDGIIYVGNTATSFNAAVNTVYHFEIKVTLDGSNGSIELRIDGQDIHTETGLSLGGPFTYLSVGGFNSSGAALLKMKNLYIWDDSSGVNDDWLGECLVETNFVDADTATADWSIASGSNGYAMLNNVPSDPTNKYIESGTISDRSIFEFPPLTNTSVEVVGVRLVAQALKTGSGAGSMKIGIIQGSTEQQSSDRALSTDTPLYYGMTTDVNPDTASKWTVSDLASTKVSFERTA